MPRILVCQHVAAEPLGTLDALIRARGHRIRFVNFERTPDAEPRLERYRGLIVLGGPMNVEDQHARPHLRTELKLIEQALHHDKPVLGICLGSQLLAHVLGAPIRRLQLPEIGWYPLELTAAGQSDGVFGALSQQAPVFEWHRYTFDLAAGAVQLARTDSCEQQAFRYGRAAYGFQFHLEMNRALIQRWLAHPGYADELADSGLQRSIADIRLATELHVTGMQHAAEEVFNGFLDLIGRPARRRELVSREFV